MEDESGAALLISHFLRSAWPRAAAALPPPPTRLFTFAAPPHFPADEPTRPEKPPDLADFIATRRP